MAFLPRWEYMTPKAKRLFRKVVYTLMILILAFWILRAFFQWLLIACFVYWIWKTFK